MVSPRALLSNYVDHGRPCQHRENADDSNLSVITAPCRCCQIVMVYTLRLFLDLSVPRFGTRGPQHSRRRVPLTGSGQDATILSSDGSAWLCLFLSFSPSAGVRQHPEQVVSRATDGTGTFRGIIVIMMLSMRYCLSSFPRHNRQVPLLSLRQLHCAFCHAASSCSILRACGHSPCQRML